MYPQFTDPEFFNQRGLLLQIYDDGTPLDLDPATHGFQLYEGRSTTEHDKVERRKDRPFFGGHKFTPTNHRRAIEGMFELQPPATPGVNGTPAEPMLLVGGMAVTLSTGLTLYNPISRGVPFAGAWWFHAGKHTEVLEARAAISGLTFKVGDRLMARTRLVGSYDEVEDEELPAIDYSDFTDPVTIQKENSTMWVNGVEVAGEELMIEYGSDLRSKERTQVRRHRIVDRVPSVRASFEPMAKATFDPYAARKAQTVIPVYATVLEDDGSVTVIFARMQIDTIGEDDGDGDYINALGGPAIPTDEGNDEFWIGYAVPLEVEGDLDAGEEGTPYSDGLTLSDDIFGATGLELGPGVWAIEGDLPDGLTFATATGVVSGTPEASSAGAYPLTISHRDAVGRVASKEVTLTITA